LSNGNLNGLIIEEVIDCETIAKSQVLV